MGVGVWGQVLSEDRWNDLLRNRQLLGKQLLSGKSGMINNNRVEAADLDSFGVDRLIVPYAKKRVIPVPLQVQQLVQSRVPYEWNLGNLLPAKGYQVGVSAGVYCKPFRQLEIQLAPELVFAENRAFEGFSQQLGNRAWADRYRFWNTTDIPDNFGTSPSTKILPGQSFIKYSTSRFIMGISTESMWWGPGSRNALVMSTNAPGFPHWTFASRQPLVSGIGTLEFEVVGGLLSASGIEPPRRFSVFNGNFVYQPKREQQRYMSGMVLSWQPKWTRGLSVGFTKAAYQYTDEISYPLDVLSLQGVLGKLTESEKAGKKASLGSFFVRYLMPVEKAELYIEFGRKEMSLFPLQLFDLNGYRRAYVAGVRKLWSLGSPDTYFQFLAEFTQLQASTAEQIRDPDSWYTHRHVRHGYTHLGRSLGAGIGPGSNSQTLEWNWIKGNKRIGFQFERVRYNSDFYYQAFEYLQDFRRHWINLSGMLKADWSIGPVFLSAQMGLVRSYNYQWLIIQYDPTNFFIPGNEILNFVGKMGVVVRL